MRLPSLRIDPLLGSFIFPSQLMAERSKEDNAPSQYLIWVLSIVGVISQSKFVPIPVGFASSLAVSRFESLTHCHQIATQTMPLRLACSANMQLWSGNCPGIWALINLTMCLLVPDFYKGTWSLFSIVQKHILLIFKWLYCSHLNVSACFSIWVSL
jgi:hypothetical protein